MPIALSIAGSDPTGGAGLQLDLQVFRALGVHGAGVLTALTVQDTRRVHRVLPVFPSVVQDQLRVLLGDITPHAIKIGMLATDDVLRAVERSLDALPAASPPPQVLDPVLAASGGGPPLLERRAWDGLRRLCARVALVTPNLPEAEALTGCDVSSRKGVEKAARRFVDELGAGAALVKGGHAREGAHDCLALREGEGVAIHWLEGERLAGPAAHGTGCALAAAVAAGLARGLGMREAVTEARRFVTRALAAAFAAGRGAPLLGLP